jgi:hypothetical protein
MAREIPHPKNLFTAFEILSTSPQGGGDAHFYPGTRSKLGIPSGTM